METLAPAEKTDAEIVRRVLAGHTEDFAGLVHRYKRPIYGLAYKTLGGNEDAEDVVIETFVKAYRALGRYRQDAAFLTWLYKIASNTCLDRIRANQSRLADSLDELRANGREPVDERAGSDPCAAAGKNEQYLAVRRAILDLDEKYRIAVLLRHVRHLSTAEVAEVMDIPEGTVKTRLARGIKMLRDRLAEYVEK